MTNQENSLNWFEISVSDIHRAKKFYETLFDIEMPLDNMMGYGYGLFPLRLGKRKSLRCFGQK